MLKTNAIDRNAVKIRRMVHSDINPILGIWWYDIPEHDKKRLASQLGGPLDLSFIAEFGGHLVGFILARLAYLGLPMTGVAVIHNIAVKPEYQDQGIGTLLVDRLESHCTTEGIKTMRALVTQHNTKLMKYVDDLGFYPSITINYDKPCRGKA